MALSKERVGEMAMIVLQHKLEQADGIRLNPKEVKREIINNSKKYGFTPQEAAEFYGIVIKAAYERTMIEIDSVKDSWAPRKEISITDKVEG